MVDVYGIFATTGRKVTFETTAGIGHRIEWNGTTLTVLDIKILFHGEGEISFSSRMNEDLIKITVREWKKYFIRIVSLFLLSRNAFALLCKAAAHFSKFPKLYPL